jgi:hypothetical protein
MRESEYVRIGQALWMALSMLPDDALRQLARGDDEPITTLRIYAAAILSRRKSAHAENN